MSPRALSAGAVARAGRREHARGPGRDGLPHEPDSRKRSSPSDAYQNDVVQALVDAVIRFRDDRGGPGAGPDRGSPMTRRSSSWPSVGFVVGALVAVVDPVRRRAALVLRSAPDPGSAAAPPRRGGPAAAQRKITATLFYVVGRRARARAGRSAKCRSAEPVVEQARQIVEAQLAARRRRWCPRSRPGTTLRAIYMTDARAMLFVDLTGELVDEAHRRLARRTLHRLHDRQRADGQPAGDHARADPGRRQGSRHARRSRRPAPPAPEEPDLGQIGHVHDNDSHRRPRAVAAPPDAHHPVLHHARRRLGPDRGGPHAGDLHGQRRGPRAAVPAQHRQGLGHRRVRHAAARHLDAHAARGERRARSAAARRRSSG